MKVREEIQLRLAKVKRLQRGKKTAMTKRIGKLRGLAEAGGCGRRQMAILLEKLNTVFQELEQVAIKSGICVPNWTFQRTN